MSDNSYQVYDTKGNFHAGYDCDCRSWDRKDALKWARLTAKHIYGIVYLKSSNSETLKVINNYSHKKYIGKGNRDNKK